MVVVVPTHLGDAWLENTGFRNGRFCHQRLIYLKNESCTVCVYFHILWAALDAS